MHGRPQWWGVWCLCVTFSMVARFVAARPAALARGAVLVLRQLSRLGVWCGCLASLHGWVCCAGVWPAAAVGRAVLVHGLTSWSFMCACAWSAMMVGRAVLVRDPPLWGLLCCCGGPPPWSGMLC